FRLQADTTIVASSTSSAAGGGGISVSVATSDTDVTSNTSVVIGQNASISAGSADVRATVSGIKSNAKAAAFAGGFVAVATADADPDINSDVNVLLEGTTSTGTILRGTQGVDVRALQNNVVPNQSRRAIPIAFIPIPINLGDIDNNLHTNVDADPGVTVFAGPRPIRDKTVAAANDADGNPLGTSLVKRTGFDRLALFVEAANSGNSDEDTKTRNINWDAD